MYPISNSKMNLITLKQKASSMHKNILDSCKKILVETENESPAR